MTYSITIFKNRYDNKTHRRIDLESWDQLVKMFYKMAERPLKGKLDAELISPAIYEAGSTRANKNVLGWAGWAAVDVDDWHFEGDLKDELGDRFPTWAYVCYSTASSTADHPKFRLIFKLTRPIGNSEIKHFWFALQSVMDDAGDKQCKDLSRMYYVPASYDNSNNFIWHSDGLAIDVDGLLKQYQYTEKRNANNFLDRLPDAFREQVIEHRKSALDNTDIYWSGYSDCPFWPRKLATDYMTISGTGWYTKMYQIMIALAGNAIKNKYPITANQIADLCKQFDLATGNWYDNRPLEKEANNALEYAYRNG
jgi:hypothetical protein